MVKFTIEQIRALMDYKHNIRNMSGAHLVRSSAELLSLVSYSRIVLTSSLVCAAVIAHVDHGEHPLQYLFLPMSLLHDMHHLASLLTGFIGTLLCVSFL